MKSSYSYSINFVIKFNFRYKLSFNNNFFQFLNYSKLLCSTEWMILYRGGGNLLFYFLGFYFGFYRMSDYMPVYIYIYMVKQEGTIYRYTINHVAN